MTKDDPPPDRRRLAAFLRTNFLAFTWKVFNTLNNGREDAFIHNWHIDAVCHVLEEARLGHAANAVINLPPRHSKSTIAAVAFSAWLLGQNPRCEIIVASHTQRLARVHTDAVRLVMESSWYKDLFPRTRLASGSGGTELRTTAGGHRLAVTAGVATMGFGADAIIIDDLLDAMEARSEPERAKVIDYIDQSLLTRISNPAKGLVICIHQRIHEGDPAGHLLNKGTFEHLNLPAIAEEDIKIPLGHGHFHFREKGSALFPQRFGLEVLETVRHERGAAVFQMLYQQNPLASEGSTLRWEWFRTYDELLPRQRYELVVQSWDTAGSAEPGAAFSVCTTWGFHGGRWHLLDVFRDRLEYPALKRMCLRLANEWKADRVLIENAATGIPLLQDCFEVNRSQFQGIRPWQEKEVRFDAACAPVEEGRFVLPREASWLPEFKRELLGFKRSSFKDQGDSFSQFVNWSKGNGFWRAIGRDHPLSAERQREVTRRREMQRGRM